MVNKSEAARLLGYFFAFSRIEAWLDGYSVCHTWVDIEYFNEFIRFANSGN